MNNNSYRVKVFHFNLFLAQLQLFILRWKYTVNIRRKITPSIYLKNLCLFPLRSSFHNSEDKHTHTHARAHTHTHVSKTLVQKPLTNCKYHYWEFVCSFVILGLCLSTVRHRQTTLKCIAHQIYNHGVIYLFTHVER